MTNRSWRRRFGILAATTLALSKPTGALFGFGDKRFKYEGLITSGSLGLDNLDGQIEALGDYNGDQ